MSTAEESTELITPAFGPRRCDKPHTAGRRSRCLPLSRAFVFASFSFVLTRTFNTVWRVPISIESGQLQRMSNITPPFCFREEEGSFTENGAARSTPRRQRPRLAMSESTTALVSKTRGALVLPTTLVNSNSATTETIRRNRTWLGSLWTQVMNWRPYATVGLGRFPAKISRDNTTEQDPFLPGNEILVQGKPLSSVEGRNRVSAEMASKEPQPHSWVNDPAAGSDAVHMKRTCLKEIKRRIAQLELATDGTSTSHDPKSASALSKPPG